MGLPFCQSNGGHDVSFAETWAALLVSGAQPDSVGFFKYYGFFSNELATWMRSTGSDAVVADIEHRLAGGDLVLHVSVDELHHRCLPR